MGTRLEVCAQRGVRTDAAALAGWTPLRANTRTVPLAHQGHDILRWKLLKLPPVRQTSFDRSGSTRGARRRIPRS